MKNNIITAEYFPEGNSEDIGKICYDVEKHEVTTCEYCKADNESFLKTYFNKAVRAIEKCVDNNEFPETVNYMWY